MLLPYLHFGLFPTPLGKGYSKGDALLPDRLLKENPIRWWHNNAEFDFHETAGNPHLGSGAGPPPRELCA